MKISHNMYGRLELRKHGRIGGSRVCWANKEVIAPPLLNTKRN